MFITHKYSYNKYSYKRISAFRCLGALFLLALLFTAPTGAAPLLWDGAEQGDFITALCSDAQGRVFVGAEDWGIWRHDSKATHEWTHFTTRTCYELFKPFLYNFERQTCTRVPF